MALKKSPGRWLHEAANWHAITIHIGPIDPPTRAVVSWGRRLLSRSFVHSNASHSRNRGLDVEHGKPTVVRLIPKVLCQHIPPRVHRALDPRLGLICIPWTGHLVALCYNLVSARQCTPSPNPPHLRIRYPKVGLPRPRPCRAGTDRYRLGLGGTKVRTTTRVRSPNPGKRACWQGVAAASLRRPRQPSFFKGYGFARRRLPAARLRPARPWGHGEGPGRSPKGRGGSPAAARCWSSGVCPGGG